MKVQHSAVTTPVYELIKTLELDIRLGDDSYTFRIELFVDTEHENRFRCRVWEFEMFRLVPTFPQNEQGEPVHISDDVMMVDRGIPRSRVQYPVEDIVAPSVDAAVEIVLRDLKDHLDHVTTEQGE